MGRGEGFEVSCKKNEMTLSGTYFDRLLMNVLPWTLFAAILLYLSKGDCNLYALLILAAAFWTIDTLVIYFKFKHPQKLTIDDNLWIGDETISLTDIKTITPVTDKRMKWSFKMIEFSLTDGRSIMVIDKPQTFIEDFLNKPSKTLTKLFAEYPELKTRLRNRRTI
jgi:hypothetical protein